MTTELMPNLNVNDGDMNECDEPEANRHLADKPKTVMPPSATLNDMIGRLSILTS